MRRQQLLAPPQRLSPTIQSLLLLLPLLTKNRRLLKNSSPASSTPEFVGGSCFATMTTMSRQLAGLFSESTSLSLLPLRPHRDQRISPSPSPPPLLFPPLHRSSSTVSWTPEFDVNDFATVDLTSMRLPRRSGKPLIRRSSSRRRQKPIQSCRKMKAKSATAMRALLNQLSPRQKKSDKETH